MSSNTSSTQTNQTNNSNENKGEKVLKPCCACPDTKKLRDNCILLNGEEKCKNFIDAHKECLRSKGFKVD